MSGGMTDRQIQLIEDFEPDAIMVTPSYMLTIVDAMIKKGIDPSKTSLRTGVFGGAERGPRRCAPNSRSN